MAASPRGARTPALVLTALVLWFLVALGLSLSGALIQTDRSRPPTLLGLAVAGPIVAFLLWYAGSAALRRFLLSLDLGWLVGVQLYRVIGPVAFLTLYYQGRLPGSFALPAGLGDAAVGISAPFVAMAVASRAATSRRLVVLWCAFGIADLVAAVTLGILNSETSLGLLAGEVTTTSLSALPLSVIPAYLVPLSVMLHLLALRRVLGGVADRRARLDVARSASAG